MPTPVRISRREFLSALGAACACGVLTLAFDARADGGVVQFARTVEPFRIVVFTGLSPRPPGPLEVSVLVQDARREQPVLDAEVSLRLIGAPGPDTALESTAHPVDGAGGLYATTLRLAGPGRHRLAVRVRRGSVVADAEYDGLTIDPASSSARALWPHLAVAPIAIAVLFLHRRLARRMGRSA
jgi:hypothetical protein